MAKKGPRVFGGETAEVERCEFCGTPRAVSADSPRCVTCGKRFPLLYSAPRAAAEAEGHQKAPKVGGARKWIPIAIVSALAAFLITTLVVVVGHFGGLGTPAPSPSEGKSAEGWAFAFERGKQVRYRVQMSTTARTGGGAGPSTTDQQHVWVLRVVSVDRGGTAKVMLRTERATVTVGGQERELQPRVEEVSISKDGWMRFAPDGRPQTAIQDALFLPGATQFLPLLPDDLPEPGDTWSKTFVMPAPLGNGSAEYTAASRLVRFDRSGLAVIESDITIPFEFVLSETQSARIFGEPTRPVGDVNVKVRLRGEIVVRQTSWFDPDRRIAVRGRANGEADVKIAFLGLPKGAAAPFTAPSDVTAAYQLEFERV